MNRILLIFSLLMTNFIWVSNSVAQKTEYFDQPSSDYRQAIELFEQQAFSPAKDVFDRLLKKNSLLSELEKENAAYYSTVCSVELGDKDALHRVETFVSAYPESKMVACHKFRFG